MAERRRRWPFVIAGTAVAVILGAWLLFLSPLPVMPEAEAAAEAGTIRDGVLVFEAEGAAPVGLIIYPGARIRPESYAPQGQELAAMGVPVFIPALTLNLAILDQEAAIPIIEGNPEIEQWVIAGHSLGGAMAARLADRGLVEGLVLWAAYPEESIDLSDDPVAVASVYGTRDLVATPDEVLAAGPRLPASTRFVAIDGGNHAQFGWYGDQRGDGEATISRDEQQDQAVAAVLAVVERVETDGP